MLGSAAGESSELLLVSREQGVPGEEGGGSRWSLDHLFIDRDGVPVLVEVKRAVDTRARREVVAQMLDYAANGVAYWPVASIIASFEDTCESDNISPEDRLAAFLDGGERTEQYWKQVEANLKAGRIRLVFVADEIASELGRIIEFLNQQMRPAEVLGIEVAQYVSDSGIRTLVPKLVGNTEIAKASKSASGQELPPISKAEWLAGLEAEHSTEHRLGAERVIGWAEASGHEAEVTKSQNSMYIRHQISGRRYAWPLYIRSSTGRVEVSFSNLKGLPGLKSDARRQAYLDEFGFIEGVSLSTQSIAGWPGIDLTLMNDDRIFGEFTAIADRLIADAISEEVS